MQGPENYLKAQNMTLPSAVDPSRTALLDADHRVFVNYEVYYFADQELKATFLKDPTEFTGELTNPVTMQRFQPSSNALRAEYAGRLFLFPDTASAQTFEAEPDRFALPVYRMPEM